MARERTPRVVRPSRAPGEPLLVPDVGTDLLARAEPSARLVLLNGFQLFTSATVSQQLPRSAQRMLAYVALHGRPARTEVAGRFWPEVPEHTALGNLRSVLHRIQHACGEVMEPTGVELALHPKLRVDVVEVVTWARRVLCDPADAPALTPVPPDVSGELLPGWYEDWLIPAQEQFRQLRNHALEVLAERLCALHRFGEALDLAHTAVKADPLRESAHRVVVRIHFAEGNIAAGVSSYRNFRRLLLDELGLEPTEQMRALVQAAGVGWTDRP